MSWVGPGRRGWDRRSATQSGTVDAKGRATRRRRAGSERQGIDKDAEVDVKLLKQ